MNICANCTHFRTKGQGIIWYDQLCGHPSVERVLTVDPVSGLKGYSATNSLGGAYHTEDMHPYARDINTSGECRLYEPLEASR